MNVPIPDRTAKADKAKTKTAELRRKFKAAHAKGMNALKVHDYDALGRVINEETQIIEAQSELLTAHRKDAAALSATITANLKTSRRPRRHASAVS